MFFCLCRHGDVSSQLLEFHVLLDEFHLTEAKDEISKGKLARTDWI